jgi:hypothetical protein
MAITSMDGDSNQAYATKASIRTLNYHSFNVDMLKWGWFSLSIWCTGWVLFRTVQPLPLSHVPWAYCSRALTPFHLEGSALPTYLTRYKLDSSSLGSAKRSFGAWIGNPPSYNLSIASAGLSHWGWTRALKVISSICSS